MELSFRVDALAFGDGASMLDVAVLCIEFDACPTLYLVSLDMAGGWPDLVDGRVICDACVDRLRDLLGLSLFLRGLTKSLYSIVKHPQSPQEAIHRYTLIVAMK